MARHKPSFFERLTGSVNISEFDDEIEMKRATRGGTSVVISGNDGPEEEEGAEEGQLTLDVFQTDDELVIQAFVAGVRLEELDVSVTQDMLTIKGRRERPEEIDTDSYFYQELYWGAFSRSVLLPQEVDVDEAQASLKNGLLTIKLRKLNRERVQRLKVKHE